jgi:hypothetical protein
VIIFLRLVLNDQPEFYILDLLYQNSKHLGHNFEATTTSPDFLFYKCKICEVLFWEDAGFLYYWDDNWIVTNLTCEEFIIKSIIE